MSLMIQSVGGGVAAQADTDSGTALGAHIMLAGIASQMGKYHYRSLPAIAHPLILTSISSFHHDLCRIRKRVPLPLLQRPSRPCQRCD